MNDHEAQRIAAAMNALRPDWPTTQLRTLLREKLGDRPRRDVAVALAWIACEAGTANPYRVLEAGPWWKAAGAAGDTTGRREVFDRGTFCGICQVPSQRHTPDDHAFISVHDHEKRVTADPAEVTANVAVLRDAARKAQPECLPTHTTTDDEGTTQ